MRSPTRPSPEKTTLARRFRHRATESEKEVWNILRNRQVLGLKFRRQHVIDGFIVDFYCAEHRLILEVDGAIHDESIRRDYDDARTDHFKMKGLRVARIRNEEVSRRAIVELLKGISGSGAIPAGN